MAGQTEFPNLEAFTDAASLSRQLDEEVDQRYPDETVTAIAATLPNFVGAGARQSFPKLLRDWAAGYLGFQEIVARRSRRRTKRRIPPRDQLQRVERSANALIEAISTLSHGTAVLLVREVSGPPIDPTGGLLGGPVYDMDGAVEKLQLMGKNCRCLIEAVHRALPHARSRGRGAPPDPARRIATTALVTIYREMTGLRPTRRYNAIVGKSYGPFRDFCIAAMKPIDGRSTSVGIDAVIASALRPYDENS